VALLLYSGADDKRQNAMGATPRQVARDKEIIEVRSFNAIVILIIYAISFLVFCLDSSLVDDLFSLPGLQAV
jgi:hypothetical protein